jgi:hypothetical protein
VRVALASGWKPGLVVVTRWHAVLVPSFTLRVSAPRFAVLLAGLLAGAPAAHAEEEATPQDVPPGRIPVVEPLALPPDAPLAVEPRKEDMPSNNSRLPGMSGVPAPKPERTSLSAWAGVAHGGISLLPVGGLLGTSSLGLGRERLWVTAAETGAGMVGAYLPSQLLFLRVSPGGRWTELEVAALGVGLALTPPLAALGTWGMGEWAFDGSQHPTRAFLGSLGGAAVGTLLGLAFHEVLDRLAGDSKQLGGLRRAIGLGFIGVGSTVGYQWAGGGPREGRGR